MFWEYHDWPEVLQDNALVQPWRVLEVEASESGFRLAPGSDIDPVEAPDLLFAKLGAKSFRRHGRIRPLSVTPHLTQQIDRWLGRPSEAQRIVMEKVIGANAPIRLYLFPWVDMTRFSEVRVSIRHGRARVVSAGMRGGSRLDQQRESLVEFVDWLAERCPVLRAEGGTLVDLATAPGHPIRLIEINPPQVRIGHGFRE